MKQITFIATITLALFTILSSCSSRPAPVVQYVPVEVPVAASVPVQPVSSIDELDSAIREASTYFNGRIPEGSKVVFLNMRSDYPDLSEYILSILSENAVNDGTFSVVDRQQLDMIRAELNFQMSGEVSDESAQNIGRMMGAEGIVSGTINKIGPLYRVQVKAIEVETAGVQGQWSKNIPDSSELVTALAERFVPATAAQSVTRVTVPTAPTPAASTSTAVSVVESPEEEAVPVFKTYKVGDTGPAGGLIFYDKGNSSGGWRYLEAAPFDLGNAEWGLRGNNIGGTLTYPGSGKQNTELLLTALSQANESNRAAQICADFELNDYDDWYLPSKDELNMLFTNLKTKKLGGFSDVDYWSSSQYHSAHSWFQNFSNGEQINDDRGSFFNKDNPLSVRAIRQF
jgi:hypothetical protein